MLTDVAESGGAVSCDSGAIAVWQAAKNALVGFVDPEEKIHETHGAVLSTACATFMMSWPMCATRRRASDPRGHGRSWAGGWLRRRRLTSGRPIDYQPFASPRYCRAVFVLMGVDRDKTRQEQIRRALPLSLFSLPEGSSSRHQRPFDSTFSYLRLYSNFRVLLVLKEGKGYMNGLPGQRAVPYAC